MESSVNRHYTLHLIGALLSLLLSYTLLLYLFIYIDDKRWVITSILALGLSVAWLWRVLRFPLCRMHYFLGAIRGHDLTMRFPASKDPMLGPIGDDMNHILQQYCAENQELEWRKKHYDRMLRVMTHELRNTVAPIVSLTKDVLSRPDEYDPERIHECFNIINEQAEGINTFLASYHQLTNVPEPVCRHIVVKDLFAKLGRLLRNETGPCELELNAPAEMQLYADPHLLTLTLINLVRNAAQALEGCDEARIEVRATLADGVPYITVTDNGPGIPENRIEHVFEPFYSTKKNGSGIGLALAYQIMMAHGGSITAVSRPNVCTTFTLQFVNKLR